MTRSSRFFVLPVATFAFALAGCAGGGSLAPSASGTGTMSGSQQSEIAANVSDSLSDGIETGLGGAVQSVAQNARTAQSLNSCITPNPNPPVLDPDGIPANETYTFANCTTLGWAPSETVNGQIGIVDTSPSGGATTQSYTQTNTNLSRAGTDVNGDSYTAVENGQRFPVLSNNVLSVTRSMQVQRSSSAHGTTNISQSWQWTFTPASGQTVQLLHLLPAGSFTGSSGTVTYANGTTNATLSFTITTPLAYDPSCATPPRIDSGAIAFTVVGSNSHNGSFTLTFPGCGQRPVITAAS